MSTQFVEPIPTDTLQFRTLSAHGNEHLGRGPHSRSPTAADEGQTRRVVVEATDGDGAVVLQTYDIVVQGLPIAIDPPSSHRIHLFDHHWSKLQLFSYRDRPRQRCDQIQPENKTDRMTIDENTGIVTWTPTVEAIENVVVEARDARGAIATQGFAVSVRDNRPPVISSTPSKNILAAVRIATRSAPPIPMEIAHLRSRQRPTGSTMDGLGRILWLVPGDFAKNGPVEVPLSVIVRDSRGAEAKQDYTLTVSADSEAPQVLLQIRSGQTLRQ